VDIGYGGDPVIPTAITVDFALDGQFCGEHPCNIIGDARKLPWFAARAFDYVYSSHCLEDFKETLPVLREWMRIVKPGGLLVLLLPDQQKYVRYCLENGLKTNPGHQIPDFGAAYLGRILKKIRGAKIVKVKENLGPYNFLLVIKKRENMSESLRDKLRSVPILLKIKRAIYPGKPPGPSELE
jgi:ubiquinone/menaquinone biosynthesis C-methylase UbiE